MGLVFIADMMPKTRLGRKQERLQKERKKQPPLKT